MLTLYTKDPCPLCDEAVEELKPYMHRVSSCPRLHSLKVDSLLDRTVHTPFDCFCSKWNQSYGDAFTHSSLLAFFKVLR